MQNTVKTNGKKEFCCDYGTCTKKYRTKFSLRRHYLSHLGIKQYKCQYCEKRFAVAQYLQEHLYTHTGERPFVCTFPGCNKSFRQAGKLSIHRKKHANESQNNSTSQDSSKEVELSAAHIDASRIVQNHIDSYELPSFFYTRELPVPSLMRESNVLF